MVKGVSKRVVVVKTSDGELFEQALFILREDNRASRSDALKEACRLAEQCAKGTAKAPWCGKSHLAAALGGAGVTGLAWLLAAIL